MRDIGPGDVVEAVCDSLPCLCRNRCSPALGAAFKAQQRFTVLEVCHEFHGHPGLVFAELPTPGGHHCFPASQFRPIGGDREAIIRQICEPVDVKELEDA